MLAHQTLQRAREPPREPPAGRDLADALGAPHIVAEESRAAILHAAGLRLGDVVEERGQLEGLPPGGAIAEDLVEVRREGVAPWLELARPAREQVCPLDGAQAVLPHVEAVRLGLCGLLHGVSLGQHDGEGAPAIEETQPRRRRRLGEDAEQLVAHALRGDFREAGRRARGRLLDPLPRRPSRPDGQPRRAEHPDGIVVQRAGGAEPDEAHAQIVEPARGVLHGSLARSGELEDGHSEGVDGEVAPPQVPREIRCPEIGDVDLGPAPRIATRARQAGGAPLLVQDDERGVETARQLARQRDGSRRHGQVEIADDGSAQRIAHGAAHQPRGPPGAQRLVESLQELARPRTERIEGDPRGHERPKSSAALS